MPSSPELEHLELLSRIDDVVARLTAWAEQQSPWEPLGRAQALVRRLLTRVEGLRVRLEAPLVVATFGGTGTGKSSLVNALVGRECTATGRERPTTHRPILLIHPQTEPAALGLPLDELERLHRLLPACDVLIYTSTQQKYRSARVGDELGQAAGGCRLLFVQTHAALEEDIREDWRGRLERHFDVPEVFFVDSLRALEEQRSGRRPSGDFGRLLDVITTALAASERIRIRRANLLDVLHAALQRCRAQLADAWPPMERLREALDEERASLTGDMVPRLTGELLSNRHLWERRLLAAAADKWGVSPFSSVLRFYGGLGNLVASLSLFRARNPAQMALIGAWQSGKWLRAQRQEHAAQATAERLGSFGPDDDALRESQIVIDGYVRAARLGAALRDEATIDELRDEAADVESRFLGDAGRRIDQLIDELAQRNTGWFTRAWYELLFLTYVGFVLYRVGRNFFYDSFLGGAPLLAVDFYVSALLMFLLWAGLLVMAYTRRLRRGLRGRIAALAEELAQGRASQGLFPKWERVCREVEGQRHRLESLAETVSDVRSELARPADLGAAVTRIER